MAPALNAAPAGAPPIIPILFITIACGAISGFHGLVSSGTSSKQLDKETDAKFVGYMGARRRGRAGAGLDPGGHRRHRRHQADWAAHYYKLDRRLGRCRRLLRQRRRAHGREPRRAGGGRRGIRGGHRGQLRGHHHGHRRPPAALHHLARSATSTASRSSTSPASPPPWRLVTCLLLAFGASAPGGGVGSGGLVIWPLVRHHQPAPRRAVADRHLGLPATAGEADQGDLAADGLPADHDHLGDAHQPRRLAVRPKPNYLMGIMGVIVLFSALWMALEAYLALRRPPVAMPQEAVEG